MSTKTHVKKQSPMLSHTVLRLSTKVSVRGEKVDTISAHNSIFDLAGYVAVAKFGNAWTPEKCETYCQSITKSKRPLLIIVTKVGKAFLGWSAPLESVFPAEDRKARQLVTPPYYRELANQPSLLNSALATKPSMWFVTTGKFQPCPLADFRLVSNGRHLNDVLRETRTALMLVRKEAPRKTPESRKAKQ